MNNYNKLIIQIDNLAQALTHEQKYLQTHHKIDAKQYAEIINNKNQQYLLYNSLLNMFHECGYNEQQIAIIKQKIEKINIITTDIDRAIKMRINNNVIEQCYGKGDALNTYTLDGKHSLIKSNSALHEQVL